jgi:hypothetical protein
MENKSAFGIWGANKPKQGTNFGGGRQNITQDQPMIPGQHATHRPQQWRPSNPKRHDGNIMNTQYRDMQMDVQQTSHIERGSLYQPPRTNIMGNRYNNIEPQDMNIQEGGPQRRFQKGGQHQGYRVYDFINE